MVEVGSRLSLASSMIHRLTFWFRGSVPLLLVVFLAQQSFPSSPESSGTKTALGGGLAELCEVGSV